MYAVVCLFSLLILFGHTAIWVAAYNRVHLLSAWGRGAGLAGKLLLLVVVCWWAGWMGLELAARRSPTEFLWEPGGPLAAYAAICVLFAAYVSGQWFWRRFLQPGPRQLLANHTQAVDVAQILGQRPIQGRVAKWLDRVPGNQMLHLHVHEKVFQLDRLPEELDGLSIVHLSDFHFSGKITRPYFEYVVDRANELDADLVAITGDLIDSPCCLDWIPAILGRLQARYGKFCILGNHDKRMRDQAGLAQRLELAGLTRLGTQVQRLRCLEGNVLLAGNELPWYGPPPRLPARQGAELRILLSHSPDQLPWARRHQFDLMLAGHTHGGQICFPIIGPVISPSRYGVQYAAGVFDRSPTLMQVSRGISGLDPIRLRCPPELARLVLRLPAQFGSPALASTSSRSPS